MERSAARVRFRTKWRWIRLIANPGVSQNKGRMGKENNLAGSKGGTEIMLKNKI